MSNPPVGWGSWGGVYTPGYPYHLPAVFLMLRNELGRGAGPYRKVEVRGQLVGVGLLTPFSMEVQGNKQVSGLAESTLMLSRLTGPHWCLFWFVTYCVFTKAVPVTMGLPYGA